MLVTELDAQITAHEKILAALTASLAPDVVAALGIGSYVAAEMLSVAGDNPDRVRSEPAFARPCGVAPIPAVRDEDPPIDSILVAAGSGRTQCTAISDANGVATCTAGPITITFGLLGIPYTATTPGTTNYQGATTTGSVHPF